MLAKSSRLWIVLAFSVIPMMAHALEVDDPEHGFHFSLPDDFVRDPSPKDPEALYQYIRRPKEAGQVGTVVEVKALKGTIAVDERLDPSKLEPDPGYNIGFDQIEWQTHKLDMIVSTPQDPERAARVVVYTTLFPLSGKAIRFRVAGPPAGEEAARPFFDKAVASFTNTKPLATDKSASERLLRQASMLVGGVVILIGLRAAAARKKSNRKKELQRLQQQQPTRPPGIRRP